MLWIIELFIKSRLCDKYLSIESFLAGYPYQMMAFAENQSINSTVDGRVKEVMVDSRINKVISRIIFLEWWIECVL